MKKYLTALLLTLCTSLVLAGCSNNRNDAHDSAIPESAAFNQADVDFATDMIQHHAQALSMVDLTDGRTLTAKTKELTEAIREAQGPEIETMVDWLNDWDQPVPETMRDHANAHDPDMEMDTDMPGMQSAEQMAELEAAQGEAFERMWLEMMIEHHQGAIEMAKTEQSDGEDKAAIELAGGIVTAQTTEIAAMEELLAS